MIGAHPIARGAVAGPPPGGAPTLVQPVVAETPSGGSAIRTIQFGSLTTAGSTLILLEQDSSGANRDVLSVEDDTSTEWTEVVTSPADGASRRTSIYARESAPAGISQVTMTFNANYFPHLYLFEITASTLEGTGFRNGAYIDPPYCADAPGITTAGACFAIGGIVLSVNRVMAQTDGWEIVWSSNVQRAFAQYLSSDAALTAEQGVITSNASGNPGGVLAAWRSA